MNKKNLSILSIILFLLFLLIILNKKNNSYKIENFASNAWTTDKKKLQQEKEPLNTVQKNEVQNMIKSVTNDQLKTLIQTQSPLLVGPQGPQGVQGPPGTTLIASGKLINKSGSYNNDNEDSFNYPKFVVTRTEGTNKNSSLSYMDNFYPFASFQSWQLNINNNLVNRFDNNCLTMNQTQDKLYMDKCSNDPNQKWTWDNSNRLISTSASNSRKLKCIGLTKPETNILTTNIPGCSGKKCMNDTPKRYLVVKDCDINNIKEDELWSFI